MPPEHPKIYHIVHVDRLPSIIADGFLWSDATMQGRTGVGTTIGMDDIKHRRLTKALQSHPGLCVGACVPFYLCPRSVMLYVIRMRNNPGLHYRGGQQPIVHLEADLQQAVQWASAHDQRWAFTTANAAAGYTMDYASLEHLNQIDWDAVDARQWADPTVKGRKQAEFLVEGRFPWALVSRVGAHSPSIRDKVRNVLRTEEHQPEVQVKREWYY